MDGNYSCRGLLVRIAISITMLALVFAGGAEAAALSNSGGGTWQYSRDITITNPGAALTDYQVLVNLTGAGFPTGANTSGADIRFTDAGDAELNYWIENWDYANRSANVWVNVTSVPVGESRMRMWYGNLWATSSSNGDATFLLFDDFNDGTLDTNKWSILNPTVVEENGYLWFGGSGGAHLVETVSNYSDAAISYEGLSEGEELPYVFARGTGTYQEWGAYESYIYSAVFYPPPRDGNLRIIYRLNSSIISDITTPFDYALNTWFKQELYVYKNQVLAKISTLDNSRSTSLTYTATNIPYKGKIAISTWIESGKIDNLRARKYTSFEPSIRYNLTGRVLNASSGLGVPGASAKIDTYPQYNATTNTTGDYSMSVPAGTYNITASFEPMFYTNSTTVSIESSDVVAQDIELVMKPMGAITGSVRNA